MWEAWHLGCKCHAVAITADEDQFLDSIDAAFDDREYKFKGPITEFPKKMKDFQEKTGFKHVKIQR